MISKNCAKNDKHILRQKHKSEKKARFAMQIGLFEYIRRTLRRLSVRRFFIFCSFWQPDSRSSLSSRIRSPRRAFCALLRKRILRRRLPTLLLSGLLYQSHSQEQTSYIIYEECGDPRYRTLQDNYTESGKA